MAKHLKFAAYPADIVDAENAAQNVGTLQDSRVNPPNRQVPTVISVTVNSQGKVGKASPTNSTFRAGYDEKPSGDLENNVRAKYVNPNAFEHSPGAFNE